MPQAPRTLLSPWGTGAAAFLLAMAVWIVFHSLRGGAPGPHSDVWDFAQQARHLSRGEGFQSSFTYPILFHHDPDPPFPNLWRFPLYPLVASTLFIFDEGIGIEWLQYLSAFFFALSAGLFAFLACRWFPWPTSALSVVLYILSPHLLAPALEGLSEPLFICLLLLAVTFSLTKSSLHLALSSLFMGLAMMTRGNALFYLPAWFAQVCLQTRRPHPGRGRAALALLCFVAICAPWLWRNWKIAGDPFFNLNQHFLFMWTEEWPGWTRFRTLWTEANQPLDPSVWIVAEKLAGNLWNFAVVQRVLSCNPIVLGFAVVGVILAWKKRSKSPAPWRLAVFLIIGDIISTVALCLLIPSIRLYSPTLPFLYLLASHGVCRLHQIHPILSQRGGTVVRNLGLILLIVSTLAYAARFIGSGDGRSWSSLSTVEIAEIRERLPSEGLIVSDLPDYLAWELDRPALWLPTAADFQRVGGIGGPFKIVHLSPSLSDLLQTEGEAEAIWLDFPDGFMGQGGKWELLYQSAGGHRFYSATRK